MKEDLGYLEQIETCAIMPLELPFGIKFDITSTMLHLLNLKGKFSGLATNDANMNMMKFMGIWMFYNLSKVSQKVIILLLFPFSLTKKAILWLTELLRGLITTWNELRTYLLEIFSTF